MTGHAPTFRRNRLLSVLLPTEPSQLRRYPMRVQRANGQGVHDAGTRIGQMFCVEQSFASMVTVADTDGDLLRTAVVLLVKDDGLVRECLSETLTDLTKESAS